MVNTLEKTCTDPIAWDFCRPKGRKLLYALTPHANTMN